MKKHHEQNKNEQKQQHPTNPAQQPANRQPSGWNTNQGQPANRQPSGGQPNQGGHGKDPHAYEHGNKGTGYKK